MPLMIKLNRNIMKVDLCLDNGHFITVFIFVALMGLTRNYFMVHYPTDILGGIMVGGISGLISYLICYKSKLLGGRT